MQSPDDPTHACRGREAGAGRQRIDDEIRQSRVPSRRPELQDFDQPDHRYRDPCRQQPAARPKARPISTKASACSPSCPRSECGRSPGGPSVVNATAAAKSQASTLRVMIIATG